MFCSPGRCNMAWFWSKILHYKFKNCTSADNFREKKFVYRKYQKSYFLPQLTREIETFLSRKFLIFIILLLKWIQIDGEKKKVSFVLQILAYLPGNMHLSMSMALQSIKSLLPVNNPKKMNINVIQVILSYSIFYCTIYCSITIKKDPIPVPD